MEWLMNGSNFFLWLDVLAYVHFSNLGGKGGIQPRMRNMYRQIIDLHDFTTNALWPEPSVQRVDHLLAIQDRAAVIKGDVRY